MARRIVTPSIRIPVKILVPKKNRFQTDSIFYAGRAIAEVVIGNREYVLTTAGEYRFSLKEGGISQDVSSSDNLDDARRSVIGKLTDRKIRNLGNNDLVSNWGWFGINLWIDGVCQDVPTDCYSRYDEAMEAFVKFVKQDLAKCEVIYAKARTSEGG